MPYTDTNIPCLTPTSHALHGPKGTYPPAHCLTHTHRWNEGEARAVLALVERLVAAGVAPEHIGIITPYSAQVRHLPSCCRHFHKWL
jgi:hypothetical protein